MQLGAFFSILVQGGIFAIFILIVLIGTKGKPMVLISQFGTFISGIVENRLQILLFSIIAILTASVTYLFFVMPDAGAGPVQPISFSHNPTLYGSNTCFSLGSCLGN